MVFNLFVNQGLIDIIIDILRFNIQNFQQQQKYTEVGSGFFQTCVTKSKTQRRFERATAFLFAFLKYKYCKLQGSL